MAVEAQKMLAARGIATRVVSVPCMDLLLELPAAKRAAIIGNAPVKIARRSRCASGLGRHYRLGRHFRRHERIWCQRPI